MAIISFVLLTQIVRLRMSSSSSWLTNESESCGKENSQNCTFTLRRKSCLWWNHLLRGGLLSFSLRTLWNLTEVSVSDIPGIHDRQSNYIQSCVMEMSLPQKIYFLFSLFLIWLVFSFPSSPVISWDESSAPGESPVQSSRLGTYFLKKRERYFFHPWLCLSARESDRHQVEGEWVNFDSHSLSLSFSSVSLSFILTIQDYCMHTTPFCFALLFHPHYLMCECDFLSSCSPYLLHPTSKRI